MTFGNRCLSARSIREKASIAAMGKSFYGATPWEGWLDEIALDTKKLGCN